MASYRKATDLAELAQVVIDSFDEVSHIDDGCRIGYQWSDASKTNKGKVVYADTELVSDKRKQWMGIDFLITFYEPACKDLPEHIMMRVMFHELLHVGYYLGDNDEPEFSIVPHDLEDFKACIDRWGSNWLEEDEQLTMEMEAVNDVRLRTV